ncbi:MAG TPA: AI-2E family transporter [Thermotogaceae bacterium]|nr:AI-2E family transporter [Thermotogaceae bacterium]
MMNNFLMQGGPKKIAARFILLYGLIFLLLSFIYPDVFTIIVSTMAIVLIIDPIVEVLMKLRGMVRMFAIIMALLIFFLSILSLIVLLAPSVIEQAGNFYNFMVNFFENKQWEGYFSKYPDIQKSVSDILIKIQPKFLDFVANAISNITKMTPQIISFLFYVILGSIYLAFYFPEFKRKIGIIFPRIARREALDFLRETYLQLRQFVISLFLVALIVGISFGVFLLFIGVKYSLLLGVWAAITNLIPIVGVVLEIIPLLLTGVSMGLKAVVTIAIAVAVVHTTAFVIFLKLMKGYIKINPVVMIFMILLSTQIFGMIGAFIAVPLTIVIRLYWQYFIYPWLEGKKLDKVEKNGEEK